MGYIRLLVIIGHVFAATAASLQQETTCTVNDSSSGLCVTVNDSLPMVEVAMEYGTLEIPFINMQQKLTRLVPFNADTCTDEHLIECYPYCKSVMYRLPKNIVPRNYDIKLVLNIEDDDFTFEGESSVSIEILCAMRTIQLHGRRMHIEKEATTLIKNDSKMIYKPAEHFYNVQTQIWSLQFHYKLEVGNYTLNMKFIGTPDPNSNHGIYRTSYTDYQGRVKWLATTHFEPIYARKMFPCWDEPAFKATFNISVEHPPRYRVLSNMPIWKTILIDIDTMWTYFKLTPVMSTYLVTITLTDFVFQHNPSKTITVYHKPNLLIEAIFTLNNIASAVLNLTTYTNISLPISKLDAVIIPTYPASGMEKWGLIIYGESPFLAYHRRINVDIDYRMKLVYTIIHEVAHQWFGNLVTPSWWNHLWLKEGMATFFSFYIQNKIHEDWQSMNLLVLFNLHYSLDTDTNTMNPIILDVNSPEEIVSSFSKVNYQKASSLLRMLYSIITDEVFREGIIIYLRTHRFSTANSDDLWSAMQTALDKSNISHKDYNIKEVMDTWTKQRQYPLLTVTRNYETGATFVEQKLFSRFTKDMYIDEDKWWIPVTFTTQTNPDFSNTVPKYWLKPIDFYIRFETDPNDWIIVNLQQTGYYRVNYDTRNWEKISNYLNSAEYSKIHVLNRAQIINDVSVLFIEGYITFSFYLEITEYLKQETDFIPWHAMFRAMEKLKSEFWRGMKDSTFMAHMDTIFKKLFEKIGYQEYTSDNDLTKLLKLYAANWACYCNEMICRSFNESVKKWKSALETDDY